MASYISTSTVVRSLSKKVTPCVRISPVLTFSPFFAIVIAQIIKIMRHIFISFYAIVIVQLIKITPSISWFNALPIFFKFKISLPSCYVNGLYVHWSDETGECRLSSYRATSTSQATQTRHESDRLTLLSR